jgi:DNA-binding NarL/FixJ family response regulator
VRRRLLSPDQIGILLVLANTGATNKELARECGLSMGTLQKQLDAMRARLGVRSREQLIIWLWKHGEIVEMAGGARRIGIRLENERLSDAS